MESKGVIWITLAALLVTSPVYGMTTLKASYNMGGIMGTITFTQESIGNDVIISLDLNGLPNGAYTLQLHEFRVNFDTDNSCAMSSIGSMIGSADATSGKGTLTASGMDLSGTKSIEGRSFVVTNGSTINVCATIEADEDYITAFANLPATLGGTIIFRQKESSPTADTMMYLDFYNLEMNPITTPLRWQINSGQVKMDIDATTTLSNRCGSTILDLYDPSAASGIGCTTENHANCRIGDLTAKHGNITIQSTGNTKLFFGDLRLPLSGDYSIIGKTIAFLNGNDYIACANIAQYPAMEGISKFSNDGVKGMVKFTQKSPLDPAKVFVNLDNLQQTAGGYHVHLYPVPQKLGKNQGVCEKADVEGHFNPFNVDVNSATYPSAGSSTPDMYEVGDISGKFGKLDNLTSYNKNFTDPNIQLYGKNSVIGRSIVIHKNMAGNPRWICSTIWPGENIAMTTAFARFTYPIIGYILLRQPQDKWYCETQVYVELNYAASGTFTDTMDHSWHVHEAPLGDDLLVIDEAKRCQSVGPHYNPYQVYLSGDYSTECNSNKQFRCEVGDLSNKHGKLNIRTSTGGKTKFFFSDLQLPLSGPQSIVGKSIVIHDANSGAGRLSCGNVIKKTPRTAQVGAWTAADGQGSPLGTITFTQDCIDILSCPTTVDVQLTGLNNQVAGYHVHQYPTGPNTPQAQLCQASDVGGHLNPFGAPYPHQTGDSLDAYEIGDLSGKFNILTGSSYSTNVLDINLPMEGPYSIVGRSIVIHKNDATATRWACGNILETTPGSKRIQAVAKFTGAIHGTIHFSQFKYTNGDMSDTFIIVDVKYVNGTQTTGHNWHVHESRVVTDCASCGPHYNPYKVDVTNNYAECSMFNPLRCEMGDQSGKVGRYDIGSGKKFFTDINLNLESTYSASKRAVVIHAANGGAPRIACADIIPYGYSVVESDLTFVKSTYDKSDIETKVANSIGTSEANVLVQDKQETIDCTTVRVYFLGDEKDNLKKQFGDVLRSGDHGQLGKYAPSGECVTGASNILQMSILTILACLCLTKFRLS